MAKNFSIAMIIRILGAITWFLYSAYLARQLNGAEFGVAMYCFTTITLFGGLGSGGWMQTLLREGARHWKAHDIESFTKLLLQSTFSAIFAAVTIGGALILGKLLKLENAVYETASAPYLVAMGIVMFAISNVLSNSMRAMGSIISALIGQGLLRSLLPLGLSLLLWTWVAKTTDSALIIFLIGLFLIVVYLAVRNYDKLRSQRSSPTSHMISPRSAFEGIRENRNIARKMWFAIAGRLVLENVDIFIIGFMLTPVQLGIYMATHRIAAVAGIIFTAVRIVAAPRISVTSTHDDPTAMRNTAAAANLMYLIGGGGVIVLLAVAGPIMLWGFGSEYMVAYPLLLIRLIGQTSFAATGPVGIFMTMTRLERHRSLIVWGGVVVAGCTTTLGVIYAGAYGAAAGYALGLTISNMISSYVVYRELQIPPAVLDTKAYRKLLSLREKKNWRALLKKKSK